MLLSRLKVITYSSHSSAISQHYGAVCCYSCRAFFRRGITRSYVCVRGDDLCQVGVLVCYQGDSIGLMQVNSITRTNCKRCRYARCLAVGMKPELVDATLKRKQVSFLRLLSFVRPLLCGTFVNPSFGPAEMLKQYICYFRRSAGGKRWLNFSKKWGFR